MMRPAGVAAIAVGLRLVLIAAIFLTNGRGGFLTQDSHTYLTPAESLVKEFAFLDSNGAPDASRTPGYPLLLAGGVLMGHPVRFALVAQAALSALIAIWVFALVEQTSRSRRMAAICGIAVAVEPTLLLWSVTVMPETLLAAFLTIAAAASWRYLESRRVRWLLVVALALSGATYTKPIAYPLVVAAACALVVAAAVGKRRVPARHVVMFVVVTAACLGSWQLRNAARIGYPTFSTIGDRAPYLGAAGAILAHQEHAPYQDVRARLLARMEARFGPVQTFRAEAFHAMRQEGWAVVRAHPLTFLRIHLTGVIRVVLDPGALEYARVLGAYPMAGGLLGMAADRGLVEVARHLIATRPLLALSSALLGLVLLPYLVMPIAAAVRQPARTRQFFVVIAGATLLMLGLSGGAHGFSRFRAPVVPWLVILAGSRGPNPDSPNHVRNRE